MQGMFYGAFQGKKQDLLRLLSKLGQDRDNAGSMTAFLFSRLNLPENWPELGDEDWAIAKYASGGSMNINYLEGPLFSHLSAYLLPIEGLTYTKTLDYGGITYTYSAYDSLEIQSFSRKSDVRSAAKAFEKATGQASVIQQNQDWGDSYPPNAGRFIPRQVLPPRVKAASADEDFLIRKGILVQYLGRQEEVIIPDTCAAIGPRAFKDQQQLKRVVVPGSVKKICQEAFGGCTALEKVELAQGLEEIEGGAFWNNKSLTHLDLPQGLTSVGWSAFGHMHDISLGIPASLKELDQETIQSLTWTEAAPDHPTYASHNGALYRRQDGALLRAPREFSGVFQIPAGVRRVEDYAFWCCRQLTGVRIPDSVQQIGRSAFAGCWQLESVALPEGIEAIESDAFGVCKALKTVTLPESLTLIGSGAFSGCNELSSVRLPSRLERIELYAFAHCEKLARLEIPDTVIFCPEDVVPENTVLAADLKLDPIRQLLPGQAMELRVTPGQDYTGMATPLVLEYFVGQDAVEQFTLLEPFVPELWNWLPELTRHAQYCGAAQMEAHLLKLEQAGLAERKRRKPPTAAQLKKLWKVRDNKDGTVTVTDYRGPFSHPILPEMIGKSRVTKFVQDLQNRDSAVPHIRTLTVPAGIQQLSLLFFNALQLERIEVAPGNPKFSSIDGVLFDRKGKTLLNYPQGRKEKHYTLPEGTQKIRDYAFEEHRYVAQVHIPEGVTAVGRYAFGQCQALTDLYLPASVTKIGPDAFDRCPNLTIHAPAGSFGAQYAKENNLNFQTL